MAPTKLQSFWLATKEALTGIGYGSLIAAPVLAAVYWGAPLVIPRWLMLKGCDMIDCNIEAWFAVYRNFSD